MTDSPIDPGQTDKAERQPAEKKGTRDPVRIGTQCDGGGRGPLRLKALDAGLDEALERGWTVVSIQNDWRKVFNFEQ